MADSEKKNVQAEGVSENGEMSEELQKKLKELDKESNTAEYKGICAKVIAVICICFSLFQIYTGFFGALDAMIQRCVHLSSVWLPPPGSASAGRRAACTSVRPRPPPPYRH